MQNMLQEILEIPNAAREFLHSNEGVDLPLDVPYVGMGSSYFACLAFKYMGVKIYPEIASEYHDYLSRGKTQPMGVILSQSGRSSEALWCTKLFTKYVAITNDPASPLATATNRAGLVDILAGSEEYSSSKTYINTLLALFRGFGMEPSGFLDLLPSRMDAYQSWGRDLAQTMVDIKREKKVTGLYITGSGPNIATAMQAALILSESTKLGFQGLPLAQFDHGPKEAAAGSIVFQILDKEHGYTRDKTLSSKIQGAGAHVFTVEEPLVPEYSSVLFNIIPFNFLGFYLAQLLDVGETFSVGGKVTEVL